MRLQLIKVLTMAAAYLAAVLAFDVRPVGAQDVDEFRELLRGYPEQLADHDERVTSMLQDQSDQLRRLLAAVGAPRPESESVADEQSGSVSETRKTCSCSEQCTCGCEDGAECRCSCRAGASVRSPAPAVTYAADPLREFTARHYRRVWSHPGEVRSHLQSSHGISAAEMSGLSSTELEHLHGALHDSGGLLPARRSQLVPVRSAVTYPVTVTRSRVMRPRVVQSCPGGVCPR